MSALPISTSQDPELRQLDVANRHETALSVGLRRGDV